MRQLSTTAGGANNNQAGLRSGDGHPDRRSACPISGLEVRVTPSTVDQGSCMALHRACPVQPAVAAHRDARNLSVSARPCPGAPPYCPV